MLTHPTLDQLHELGLAGMASAFAELQAAPQTAELSHAEWLALLLDREVTERRNRRLKAKLRYARLRHHASVEDEELDAPQRTHEPRIAAVAAGERQVGEEARNALVEDGEVVAACFVAERASEP